MVKKKAKETGAIEVETITVHIDDVHPNSWNPNRQRAEMFEKEVESLKRYGYEVNLVLVRVDPKGGFEIIDGEHRWRAMRELGHQDIKVRCAKDCSDRRARKLTILLNDIHGTNDQDALANLLVDLGENHGGGFEDVLAELPYGEDEVRLLLDYSANAWGMETGPTAPEVGHDDWVKISVTVKATDRKFIEAALRHAGKDSMAPKEVRNGVGLAIIAGLYTDAQGSTSTPAEKKRSPKKTPAKKTATKKKSTKKRVTKKRATART